MSSPGAGFEILAEVRRGGVAESWHHGAVAVTTPAGEVVDGCGDSELQIFVRSAAKPFQILPLLDAGGIERFELSDADLALICASHSGNPEHVGRSARLLEKGGFAVEALRCGAHRPMNPVAAAALDEANREPNPLHNNCSGKHAGQLLVCRLLGFDPESYEAPEHPLQRRIVDEIERFFDLDALTIGRGIDGCSLPTFRVPLAALARSYAKLADPHGAGLEAETAARADLVFRAMTGAPEMVAGEERFTTRLIRATGGRVLGKEGAEGVYAMAVRGPRPLGVALKIADGGERARDAVVIDTLERLGLVTEAELEPLAGLRRPRLENWRGLAVGEIVPRVPIGAPRHPHG